MIRNNQFELSIKQLIHYGEAGEGKFKVVKAKIGVCVTVIHKFDAKLAGCVMFSCMFFA
jgi:hypothetical protein